MTTTTTTSPPLAALGSVDAILNLLLTVAGALSGLAPGITILGFSLSQIIVLARAIREGAKDVAEGVASLFAAASGAPPPTPEQLLAIKTALDSADDEIQATNAMKQAAERASTRGPIL